MSDKKEKFNTKKIFLWVEKQEDNFPKTSVSENIDETNEKLAKKSQNTQKESIKELTWMKLNFLDKNKDNTDFEKLFLQKNYKENLEKILDSKKTIEEKNNFWFKLDEFIEKNDNPDFIEKYLEILKLRKNSCPSEEFILKIRKNLEKLLYKDLEKSLKWYKTSTWKDAYKAMQEEIEKDYCSFDLKKFLENLEDENQKKLDIENFYKITKNFSSIKEQKIEEQIYKTTGYTTTTLGYLDKKDLDKMIDDLSENKRKKLKKLFKQKKLVKSFRKNYLKNQENFEKFLNNLEKKETKKEEIQKNILSQTNSEIIDYIFNSKEKEFELNLARNSEKKVNLKIIKKDNFFEVKVGESSIRCENLFELENILDTWKYFSFIWFYFLIPYFTTIFELFRQKTHFKFDFKDGLNIKEHKKIQEILIFLLDLKGINWDLWEKDEKIKDLSNKEINFFYKKAIKTSWFKEWEFKKLEFEKKLEGFGF